MDSNYRPDSMTCLLEVVVDFVVTFPEWLSDVLVSVLLAPSADSKAPNNHAGKQKI